MPSASGKSIETTSDVVFSESTMQRFTIVVQTVFVIAVLGFASVAIVWGLVPLLLWPLSTPWWWHVAAAAIVIVVVGGIVWFALPQVSRRLTLRLNDLCIGGMTRQRTIRYDDVRMVRLAEEHTRLGPRLRLIIEPALAKPATLVLAHGDAEECLSVLREFCERAAAMDQHDNISLPHGVLDAQASRNRLLWLLRRRAWFSMAGGIAVSVAFAWIVWMLSQSLPSGVDTYVLVLLAPICAARLFMNAWSNFRKARELLEQPASR